MSTDPFDIIREQWRRERPDLDTSGLEVLWRISFLHKQLKRTTEKRIARSGLPNWAFDVLAALRRQGAPFELSPSELCEATLLTSGAMTNRLDRLEDDGLVERHPAPDDRRSLIVRLTEKGQETVDDLLAIRFDQAKEAISGISEPQRQQLVDLLRKLVLAGQEA